MSRIGKRLYPSSLGLLLAALSSMSAPAEAQSPQVSAEQALENARNAYGPPSPGNNCPTPMPGEEIVVCGETQDDSEFRVQSSSQLDPNSDEALKDPIPRAPNVDGDGIFKGPATMSGGCFLNKCPPPPAYMIDFSELPDPPEGSDADKIAKGEMDAP